MENWKIENEHIFDRRYLNPIKKWWIDIDKISFLLVIGLIIFGLMMSAIASPAVARKISVEDLFFVKKQTLFAIIALLTIVFISFLNKQQIKLLSIAGILTCLILLILVLGFGVEAKGAKRWITIFGFTIQPSEFAKIFFVVFNAFLLQKLKDHKWYIKYGLSTVFYLLTIALVIFQPDFGMTLIFTALWLIQLFIFGLPMLLIALTGIIGCAGIISAYFTFPHVENRINRFFDSNSKNYQVERSIDGYVNGSFFGTGPGNGIVKQHIPDAHTDFIFSVVAEEFGVISCLLIMLIILFIITRIVKRIGYEDDLFSILAVVGLVSQIALQFIVNIGVSVGMLPTKGMTLPFISYGGSSTIAIAIGFGIILSLTKKKYDNKINYDNVALL
jgi:cell division protein FtsW